MASDRLLTIMATHGVALPHDLICRLAMEAMLGGSNSVTNHGDVHLTKLQETLLAAGFRQHMPDFLPAPTVAQWVWYGKNDEATDYVAIFGKETQFAFPRSLARSNQFDSDLEDQSEEKTADVLQEVATSVLVGLNDLLHRDGQKLFDSLERELGFAPCSVGFTHQQEL